MSGETNSPLSSQGKVKNGSNQRIQLIALVTVTALLSAVAVFAANLLRAPAFAEIQTFDNLSPEHTTSSVLYPQNPPVGGPHDPVWQNCGIYEQPVRNENAVHSLEHGVVWLTYQPNLPADVVESLKELVGTRRHILLSPYPNLPVPIVATAWGVQLQLNTANKAQLTGFITTYLQGAQSPEPGAPCIGGLSEPL